MTSDTCTARVMLPCFIDGARDATIEAAGEGGINATFRVSTGSGVYMMQRISPSVFADPGALEYNYEAFLAALDAAQAESGGTPGPEVPRWQRSGAGRRFAQDGTGAAWRLYPYIAGRSIEPARGDGATAAELSGSGNALAWMHYVLKFYGGRPRTVIPHFHELDWYVESLDRYSASADPSEHDPELDLLIDRDWRGVLKSSCAPRISVIHGDAKLGNLLFDDCGRVAAFIDLDTFCLSSKLVDIADAVRSAAVKDGGAFDAEAARQLIDGYLSSPLSSLTDDERRMLPAMMRRMPFELGVRLYADHLAGDRYFRTAEHGNNLRRARVQFRLYLDMAASIR